MTTIVLTAGNPHVRELDLDEHLKIVASRPTPALLGKRLAAMPEIGSFPKVIFAHKRPPIAMDCAVESIRIPGVDLRIPELKFGRNPARRHRAAQTRTPAASEGNNTPEAPAAPAAAPILDERAEHDEAVGPTPTPAPAAPTEAKPTNEEPPKIRLLICSDAAAAAGFRAGDIVPVASFGRGYAYVEPRVGGGPPIIVPNRESQPVAQEAA